MKWNIMEYTKYIIFFHVLNKCTSFIKTVTYKIVGSNEADPLNGKLSNASLVGQHLMGRKAGETIEFPIPDGMAKYKIMEVKR